MNIPSKITRQRRDELHTISPDHQHAEFSDTSNWRELLSCRECKRNLVLYLGKSFMSNISSLLWEQQRFVLSGCFSDNAEDQTWALTFDSTEPIPDFNSNAEEADTQIWLHVLRSNSTQILVCSPDTDVFHIGLPIIGTTEHVIVQIHPYTSIKHQYLHLDKLCLALNNDPDLSTTPQETRPKLLQTLFICTGCDYISFFYWSG